MSKDHERIIEAEEKLMEEQRSIEREWGVPNPHRIVERFDKQFGLGQWEHVFVEVVALTESWWDQKTSKRLDRKHLEHYLTNGVDERKALRKVAEHSLREFLRAIIEMPIQKYKDKEHEDKDDVFEVSSSTEGNKAIGKIYRDVCEKVGRRVFKFLSRIHKRTAHSEDKMKILKGNIYIGHTMSCFVIKALNDKLGKLIWFEYRRSWNKKKRRDVNQLFVMVSMKLIAVLAHDRYYLPMRCRPQQWTPDRLKYGPLLEIREPIVRRIRSEDVECLKATGTPVFNALNHLASTKWAVHRHVFEIVNELMKWPEHKLISVLEVDKNGTLVERDSFERMRAIGESLMDRSERHFYYPYRCDFRGRVYPMTLRLNPQGSDLERSLLRFANGKVIGSPDSKAARWLKRHGASCHAQIGLDRVSFEKREKWVDENTHNIKNCANAPLSDESIAFWTKADKKWQFLAFCIEWNAYLEDPLHFESTLPVFVDGTCNAFQHYAALSHDENCAWLTNLKANSGRQDLYDEISKNMNGILDSLLVSSGDQSISESHNLLSETWDNWLRAWELESSSRNKKSKDCEIVEAIKENIKLWKDNHLLKNITNTTRTQFLKDSRHEAEDDSDITNTTKAQFLKEFKRQYKTFRVQTDLKHTEPDQTVLNPIPYKRKQVKRLIVPWAYGAGTERLGDTYCKDLKPYPVDFDDWMKLSPRYAKVFERYVLLTAFVYKDKKSYVDALKSLKNNLVELLKTIAADKSSESAKKRIRRIQRFHDALNALLGEIPDYAKFEGIRKLFVSKIVKYKMRSSSFLTTRVCKRAITNLVTGACDAKMRLEEIASIAAEVGRPFAWTTPSGWQVRQRYVKRKKVPNLRILRPYGWDDNVISGLKKKIKFDKYIDIEGGSNSKKSAISFPPNFIHSLDASMLILTVLKFYELKGGDSLSVVHDSFATHAADMDSLNQAIRESFIEVYKANPWDFVKTMYDCTESQMDLKELSDDKTRKILTKCKTIERWIEERSSKPGVINELLESEYFFS